MATLKEVLLTPENRPKVVSDAARLVEEEVDNKSGLTGIAVKTAYKAVKALKPGLIPDTLDGLIDKFVDKLEPFYTDWVGAGKTQGFDQFLAGRKDRVANALLGVTDDRARVVHNATLKKSYQALRPQGEKHVEAAVPGLGRVLAKYVK